jgi:hypothetical protein
VAYAFTFTAAFTGYNSIAGAREEWTSCAAVAGFGTGVNGVGFEVIRPDSWRKTLAAGSNGMLVHVHCRSDSFSGDAEIVRILDVNGALVFALTRLSTGIIRATGATGFTTSDSNTVVNAAANTKYDIGYLFSNTVGAGRLEVRINGARENSLTSSAFAGGTLAAFRVDPLSLVVQPRGIMLGAVLVLQSVTYDAVAVQQDSAVWADTSGFPWVGNRSKFGLVVNGAGTYEAGTAWTANGAPTPHECVDDIGPGDQDATHISLNAIAGNDTDRCSFTMADLPSNTSSVTHVCHKAQMRSAPTGTTAKIKLFLDNGTIVEGSEETLPTDATYTNRQVNHMDAPGSSGWTRPQVNAVQSGVRGTSIV